MANYRSALVNLQRRWQFCSYWPPAIKDEIALGSELTRPPEPHDYGCDNPDGAEKNHPDLDARIHGVRVLDDSAAHGTRDAHIGEHDGKRHVAGTTPLNHGDEANTLTIMSSATPDMKTAPPSTVCRSGTGTGIGCPGRAVRPRG
jgi:hypothetical protein